MGPNTINLNLKARQALPELPEVETIRRDLANNLTGRTIEHVLVTGRRSVRRQDVRTFVDGLAGATIRDATRVGKYLLLPLGGSSSGAPSAVYAPAQLIMHLRMSGQLRLAARRDEPITKHTHIRLQLTDDSELRFVDPRTFGEMWWSTNDGEVPHLGPDALEGFQSWHDFATCLRSHRRRLKALLMDQKVVAGIGNIYSDEILFVAGLHPDEIADRLPDEAIQRLYRAMISVLAEAIEHRGSSLADGQYVDLLGRQGDFGAHHRVYARAGQDCFACGSTVERLTSARRAHVCLNCQPSPSALTVAWETRCSSSP